MLIEVMGVGREGVAEDLYNLDLIEAIQELRTRVNKLHKPGCQECSLLLNTLVPNKKQICASPSVEN